MNNLKEIKIISIEGNIGSGKSTLINSLKTYYNGNKNVYFLQEPVSEWENLKDKDNKNIIEKFYEDQEKYSFSFQMMAYISRLSMLKNAINYCKENNIYLIVCERSLQTDKNVFCKMLYDTQKINEINFKIYNKWFNEFISDIPKIIYIYIKTNPVVAFERIMIRNRKGETINLQYLEMCSSYHDTWLNNTEYKKDVIIINGDNELISTFESANSILKNFI